jgi:hypothetical protein
LQRCQTWSMIYWVFQHGTYHIPETGNIIRELFKFEIRKNSVWLVFNIRVEWVIVV